MTDPFTDFSVDRVSKLSITRAYNSSDYALQTMSTGGIFALGWHHDWEAELTCSGTVCTVSRGTLSGYKFAFSQAAPSPDGSETWNVYAPYAPPPYAAPHRNVLVARPGGEWIVFLTDGRELHFAVACTSCDGGNGYCSPLAQGGRARLTKVVDPAGNGVSLSYDGANRVLLRLTDDLGHALEVRNASACSGYATELRYDGLTVAKYTQASNQLTAVQDSTGKAMRTYQQQSIGAYWTRLGAVLDEGGAAIAEFSYDSSGRAIGVVDKRSSVGVSYTSDGWETSITEYFRGPSGDTATSSTRTLDYFGHVVGMGPSSMGRGGALKWTDDGRLACSVEDGGVVKVREYDAAGHVVHSAEFAGQDCTVPNPLPADAREEWREYGVVKTVAQGLGVNLDLVTKTWKRSGASPTSYSYEQYDYSPAAAAGDPSGYACTQATLPAGSVVCRQISAGYVPGSSGATFERHATFYSYDRRGRLIRTYGPVNLDNPGPNDVPPLEERVYWGDGDSSARQGRLREVRVYPSPTAVPLVTSYDYDAFGVFSTVAPDGATTTIVKDARGRPTRVTVTGRDGLQSQTETRYYDGLTPRLRILPTGAAERYSYDLRGRLLKLERLAGDPEAQGASFTAVWTESYTYDQAGNQIHLERRDSAGAVKWSTDRAYDSMHRVVWESNPSVAGAGRSTTYDESGFQTASADEEGRTTQFTPDGLRRVAVVRRTGVDANGSPVGADVARYAYNPGGDELASVTDGTGRATSYVYDDFGQLRRLSSPNLRWGGDRWFTYDARGNLVAKGDSEVSVAYKYDGLDRLLLVSAQRSTDGNAVWYDYWYDQNGNAGHLTSITGAETTVAYAYDGLGRMTSFALSQPELPAPMVTTYRYDADGSVSSMTYPSGLVVTYDRDPATRQVTRVRSSLGDLVSSVQTLPFGPVAALTFGNGTTLAQTFNLRYEPQTLASGPLSLAYLMSPAGDITQVVDRSADPAGCTRDLSRTLTYDFLDRLVSWSDTRTNPAACAPTIMNPIAASNEYVPGTDAIAKQSNGSGVATLAFGYDHQGNVSVLGRYDASGAAIQAAACLRHDALGRVSMVGDYTGSLTPGGAACLADSNVATVRARFRVDADNRRVARWIGGAWSYVVSGESGAPLSELAATGVQVTPLRNVRDYVWLDGRIIAQIEYGSSGSTSRVYAVHTDHLGTPRAVTTQEKTQVWGTYQRPFGELGEFALVDAVTGQSVVTNLRLPGQYDERLLGPLGLQGPYYNWNRWYFPRLGRYLEADPLALDGEFNSDHGVDWYNYASGNPLRYTDPFGLFTKDKTCLNLPKETDVIKAADAVTDVNLKQCILKQNEHAHLGCPDQEDPECCDNERAPGACAAGPGTCKVTWCNRTKQTCSANILVHEFAHNCGWNHKGGKGVPYNSGVMPGSCNL